MKKSIVLLCAIAVSALLLGCKDKDLSAPKNPKMVGNDANANPPRQSAQSAQRPLALQKKQRQQRLERNLTSAKPTSLRQCH